MDRIDALRLFVRLAERKSFSAAARDLHIKQPTASKWVAELEAELGAGLVRRTTRAVHVTDAGHRLLARATDVLAAFDAMKAEFDERSAEPSGRLRLSVPVVLGRRLVAPALAEFLERHRLVQAEVVFEDRYVNLVDAGVDLAVRVGVPADTSARGTKLADGRRVLVASPAYLAARGEPAAPADLGGHECLVHGVANAAAVWRFGGAGAGTPVAVRGRFAANNSEAVLLMARRGLGLALLADWLVAADLRRGRLVSLLDGFPAPPAPIYALSPPGKYASTAVRALTGHLAAALASRLAVARPGAPATAARAPRPAPPARPARGPR